MKMSETNFIEYWQAFMEWFAGIPLLGQILIIVGVFAILVLALIGVYYLLKGLAYLIYYILKGIYCFEYKTAARSQHALLVS